MLLKNLPEYFLLIILRIQFYLYLIYFTIFIYTKKLDKLIMSNLTKLMKIKSKIILSSFNFKNNQRMKFPDFFLNKNLIILINFTIKHLEMILLQDPHLRLHRDI